MDPHCFDSDPEPDPDPAQNLDADPDPDPDPRGGRSAKMCIPPGKILGTPLLATVSHEFIGSGSRSATWFTGLPFVPQPLFLLGDNGSSNPRQCVINEFLGTYMQRPAVGNVKFITPNTEC